MTASLNERLKYVKWGEYKINQLFKEITIKRKIKCEDLTSKGAFPAYSSDSENNGIVGYYSIPEFICDSNNPVYVIFGDHTRTMSIARKSFSVLDNVKVLHPNIANDKVLLFIFAVWKKQIPNLGYKRHWSIAKNCIVKLPIKSQKLDIEFMESFIAELEAERIAGLSAYLKASGLDNYELSKEEENAIENLGDTKFEKFDLIKIFNIKNTSNLLSRDIREESGTTPYLCASADNNSVSSYISHEEKYLEKGNCIFIGGKTFVVSYQDQDFFSNDSHNLALHLIDYNASKKAFLYLATCLYKSLKHKYSWGDSVSKAKIKTDKILLPSKNGKPDYQAMELLISAVQKLVIKDVVQYADSKIKNTKKYTPNKL